MAQNYEAARRHLDDRFSKLGPPILFTRPPKGWIRAIRDALGMTTTQLAKRLGMVQSRIVAIEKDEADDRLTLATLRRVAEALDCQLVYTLIPNQSLLHTVEVQADRKAKAILAQTEHTMKLEDQGVQGKELQAQYDRLLTKLLQGPPTKLWDEP